MSGIGNVTRLSKIDEENEEMRLANDTKSPQVHDESFVSGSTPDPESDDDVIANAHDMGLYMAEDEEHPQELGLGEEIDKAEAYNRSH